MRLRAPVFCRNAHTMTPRPFSLPARRCTLAALAALALSGCASTEKISGSVSTLGGLITPYKIDILQGNVVTREQAQALQPGLPREQVRAMLGTPLLASVFHADRWDYVFTMRRQRVEPQNFRLTVFFKGDALERFEGDEMPSENDFVERIGKKVKPKVPVLEATEEQLAKFPASTASEPEAAAPEQPEPARPGAYPPLEPAR